MASRAAESPVRAEELDAALAAVLAQLVRRLDQSPTARVRVLDCGGGSGRRAVPLAVGGADVTVLDVSIDALAILARRAAEAGVPQRVHAIQADIDDLADFGEQVTVGAFDLVLLHDVLGTTSDPAAIVTTAARGVGAAGFLSIVVTNPAAAVLARALGGDLSGALAGLVHDESATGSSSRVESSHELAALVTDLGFVVVSVEGLGAISSLVPGAVLDGRPGAAQALAELDRRVATRSPYREIAGQLHLLARNAG